MSKRNSSGGAPSRDISRGRTGQPEPTPVPATARRSPSPKKDTIGTHLTAIANSLNEALRVFQYADKRFWDPEGDEYEQIRALEETVAQARRDFIEMGKLVGGVPYYEGDRRVDTTKELAALSSRFTSHTSTFKSWSRTGGPINHLWISDTLSLRRDLHRAQRRAAGRIYVSDREGAESTAAARCLGADIVDRVVRRVREQRKDRPAWQQTDDPPDTKARRGSLESVVPDCNSIGQFERMGETDIAFVCDFCDGFLVWPDLRSIPTERKQPGSLTEAGYPNWAAAGRGLAEEEAEEEKSVVFAPLAIANHLPPKSGEWMSRIICPFCEEYTYIDQGDGDGERKWEQPEGGFESVEAFREHLVWTHTALPRPPLPTLEKCEVM